MNYLGIDIGTTTICAVCINEEGQLLQSKTMPNISLGTVYRNLRVLSEAGEIMELDFGSGYSRYDGNPDNHYHFECRKCGKMYDVDLDLVNHLDKLEAESLVAIIEEHRLEFYGICRECRNVKN